MYADKAEQEKLAAECEAKNRAYAATQTQAANLYSPGAIGRERNDPSFALEAAAAVTRTLENFYPGNFAVCSRRLTRAEKIAALCAAIVAYEHLNW